MAIPFYELSFSFIAIALSSQVSEWRRSTPPLTYLAFIFKELRQIAKPILLL